MHSLKPGERLDDLMIKGLKLIQHEDEFRFSLDAVLLANFATLKKEARAVDLGTGTGVIALLLAARGAQETVGVEISPLLAEMAARSIALNGLAAKARIIEGDLLQVKDFLPAGQWDTVVSNPPYRPLGEGFLSPKAQIARARHEASATLRDVVGAARFLVKYRGRFAMVHLPERLAEIMAVMRDAQLEPKRLQLIYPKIGRKPNLVLIEGVRGAKSGLDVLPPLVVYNSDGSYTEDILSFYHKEGK
ncbi:MAG: tRNA1(Val) (adenine(37)-N6)-methyltransferase [Sporomusaceae bacterium]|jgi:tRNA1(Val) A37 N6-methylase TrmN6|nr:tRNA1(Val) (adenine(37)-N6)-methyltransferase [Sporomusaceae bacterium]